MTTQLDIEEVFDHIGHFGVYQLGIFILTGLIAMEGALQPISTTFLHGEQDHWCEIERLSNFSYDQQRYIAIPWDTDDEEFEQCRMFDLDYESYTDEELIQWNRTAETSDAPYTDCDMGWVYEQSDYKQSIVNEWDLVCDKSWIQPFTTTIYLSAVLAGYWIGGYLADAFGRKRICCVSCIFWCLFAFISVLSPNQWWYIALRWTCNCFQTMAFVSSFVLLVELVGQDWRVRMGIAFQFGFSFGFVVIPWIAYFVRGFKYLQIVIAAPLLVFITYFWVLPESPRWLVVKGRIHEAEQIFREMGEVNRRPLPADFRLNTEPKSKKEELEKEDAHTLRFIDLLKSPYLRAYTVIVYFLWFAGALVYYGISINTGDMVGSVHLNTFLVGAVEFPGNAIAIISMDRIGRRNPIAVANIVAGLSMIAAVPFIGNDDLSWLVIMFTLIGKGAMTLSFNAMFVITAEIFPTPLRNLVLGSASAISRIASASTPYFGEPAMEIWEPLPSLVFGIFASTAGLLTFVLPETIGLRLPDTIEESEEIAKRRKQKKVDNTQL